VLYFLAEGALVCLAQTPRPGSVVREIFVGPGIVPIRFVHCPAGFVPRGNQGDGDPRKLSDPVKEEEKLTFSGFFISEAEITQEQFAAVLGSPHLEAVKKRVKEGLRKDGLDRYDKADIYYSPDGQYPVFGVTATEAVDFCMQLEKLEQSRPRLLNVVTNQIRLPTHFEWQYACRAEVDPKVKPHFSEWPQKEDTLDKMLSVEIQIDSKTKTTVRKVLEDRWAIIDSKTKFNPTQDNILAILEELSQKQTMDLTYGMVWMEIVNGRMREAEGKVRKELHDSLKIIDSPYVAPIRPEVIPAEDTENWRMRVEEWPIRNAPNAWGVRRMYDNVPEWTVFASNPAEMVGTWKKLEKGAVEDAKNIEFCLAGGGITVNYGSWWRFTIWMWAKHEQRWRSEKWTKVPVADRPGIRVVMERTLRENWFASIRESLHRKNDDGKIVKELDSLRDELPFFGGSQDVVQNQRRVHFYRALAQGQASSGNDADSLQVLQQASQQLATEDPYFRHLATAIDRSLKE